MNPLRNAGALIDLPDEPGVYVMVCGYMGATSHHLGEILYIGLSTSIRRRVAYALAAPDKSAPHNAQQPLFDFQRAGGVAHLLYCALPEGAPVAPLEAAVLDEFFLRTGRLPAWNSAKPRAERATPEARTLAAELLDRLNVR